jgi:hypothetical protein
MKLREFIEKLQREDLDADVVAAPTPYVKQERIRNLVRAVNRDIQEFGKEASVDTQQIEDALFDDAEQQEPLVTVRDQKGRRTVCIQ